MMLKKIIKQKYLDIGVIIHLDMGLLKTIKGNVISLEENQKILKAIMQLWAYIFIQIKLLKQQKNKTKSTEENLKLLLK